MRLQIRGGVEGLRVHVVLQFTLREADDERGHGHFDVKFNHVDDGVELDVYNWVFKKHKAN
jgi:hypothetical protein